MSLYVQLQLKIERTLCSPLLLGDIENVSETSDNDDDDEDGDCDGDDVDVDEITHSKQIIFLV